LKQQKWDEKSMEEVWIATAEISMQPGDTTSGDTLGFMRITMWATSPEEFLRKLQAYFATFSWIVLGLEDASVVDPSTDYGDELNQLVDETLRDRNRIGLATFFSYRPN
jgi:hypothetical protein